MGATLEIQAVELLGEGQQYVVEGIHPKTGKPYYWRDGVSPADVGIENLPAITLAEVDLCFARIEACILSFGGTIVGQSHGSANRASVGDAGLYAPSLGAVERALAAIPNDVDYDTWLKVGAAVKGAAGEEGYPAWEAWSLTWAENTPEVCHDKWASLRPPFKLGWPWLSSLAGKHGFSGAREDFGFDNASKAEEAEPKPEPDDDGDADRKAARQSADMFGRSVFVENLECAFDLATLRMRSKMQFNAQWWTVGDPADSHKSAWAVFMRGGAERRNVISATYRPNGKLFVEERGVGMCVNLWRDPGVKAATTPVNDNDVSPWLDHVAYLVPDPRERTILLDLLAAIVQRPDLKPNFGLCMGSQHQGVGKSIMLEPVRYLLGAHNVREIGPEEIASSYSGWAAETKLLIVEEMHSFDRKATMNKLKALVAAPPWRLYVNPKYGKPFEVPNLLAAVFFTNHYDALQLELNDRRFFVLWAPVEPKPDLYYTLLMSWFREGGDALAGAWLMQRDVSHFNMQGRAPATTAKENMRRMTRPLLDEWIEEGIEAATAPFNVDLVTVKDVWASIPDVIVRGGSRPTQHKIAAAISRYGGKHLGRVTVSGEKVSVYSVRRHRNYASLAPEMLAARLARMRADPDKETSSNA